MADLVITTLSKSSSQPGVPATVTVCPAEDADSEGVKAAGWASFHSHDLNTASQGTRLQKRKLLSTLQTNKEPSQIHPVLNQVMTHDARSFESKAKQKIRLHT